MHTTATPLRILVFLAVACALSFGAKHLPALPLGTADIRDLLCGAGPLLSGLLCYRLFGTRTEHRIFGGQPLRALLLVLATALTFVFTQKGDTGAAVTFVVVQLLYCFGEEFGWRHYLQSETAAMNRWLQPFVIGTVWFAWHFSWLDTPLKTMMGDGFNAPLPVGIAAGIVFLSLFSMFLGWTMQKSHAVVIPVLLHFAIKTNSATLLVTVAACVAACIFWDKKQKAENKVESREAVLEEV